ncbi:MerR family transcriptional regulator [bacterium]|nr:MerR family transcriptional regulator [bacterium]
MENIYLVKDLSGITGVSVYTIKYYLKLGLIKEIGRTSQLNYRYFNDFTVKQLAKIRRLRKEGISIGKIQSMIKEGALK